MVRKLTIVFFDAGGGHRSAAEALKSVLESQRHPWQVNLLNLQDELDRLDLLRRTTGIRIQDAYNLILRKGWTRLTPQLLPVLQSVVRLYHRRTVKCFANIGYSIRLTWCFRLSHISIAHWRKAFARPCRRAVRHVAHRSRRLSPAFLDGARI